MSTGQCDHDIFAVDHKVYSYQYGSTESLQLRYLPPPILVPNCLPAIGQSQPGRPGQLPARSLADQENFNPPELGYVYNRKQPVFRTPGFQTYGMVSHQLQNAERYLREMGQFPGISLFYSVEIEP